jgi:hypothetical protein
MIARLALPCCRDPCPEFAAMRHTVAIGLSLFVSAAALLGAWAFRQPARFSRAAVGAAATSAGAPIPQDGAAIAKRRHDLLAWNRRTVAGAYEAVGKKDARWDEPARKAMELAARMFSQEVDPDVTLGDVYTSARDAIDAGCDDPMVLYLYSRASEESNDPGGLEASRRGRKAADALAASRYPAIRRAVALQKSGNLVLSAGGTDPGDAVRKEAEREFDAALALLDESVSSDERNEFWEASWLNNLLALSQGYRALGVPAEVAYERVDAGLARVAGAKVLRLLFRGEFWLQYGWEARGTGFAATVSARGWEALENRLAVAREAFEQAWQLEPGLGLAADNLLAIDKAIDGDRATMELWFDRAMRANVDDRSACWSKLDWLDPKWHGSEEEMLAFGRACRDTKNWRTGITLLVGDAHFRIAGRLGGKEQARYMSLPEVWADIQPVYDEYLKHHPNDDVARSKYATFCYLGGHYREAEAQYVALGDRLTQWSEFPYYPLDVLKKYRNRTAEIIATNPTPLGLPGWHFVGGKNKDSHWTVNVPVAAERKEEAGILGAKVRNVWTCTADGVSYRFRLQPVPPALRNEGSERVLDAARAVIAQECGGQPRDVCDARLANRPAQEYHVDAPDLRPKLMRVRTAVIGTWLFELSVTASETDVGGKSANEFFDSFTFREQSSPSRDAGGQ